MVPDTTARGARLAISGFLLSGILLVGALVTSPLPFGNPVGDLLCRTGVTRYCPQPVAIELPQVQVEMVPVSHARVVGYGAVSGVP